MKEHTLKDSYERTVGKAVRLFDGTILIRNSSDITVASYDPHTEIIKNSYGVQIGKAVIIESHNPYYRLPDYIIKNSGGVKIGVYDANTNILKDSYDRKIGYGFAINILFDL